jgi:hypothetical protein
MRLGRIWIRGLAYILSRTLSTYKLVRFQATYKAVQNQDGAGYEYLVDFGVILNKVLTITALGTLWIICFSG